MSAKRSMMWGWESIRQRLLSIQTRLLVLTMMGIAPLIIERARTVQIDRAEQIDEAYKKAQDLVRQGLERQQEVVVTVRSVLQTIARLPVIGAGETEQCGRLVSDIAADVRWLGGVFITDADGKVTCTNFAAALGASMADRHYYRAVAQSGDFVLSDYIVGRLDGRPRIMAALPRRDTTGTNKGVIAAGVDLKWTGQLSSVIAQTPGASVLLIDGQGTVLTRHPDPANWVGQLKPDHPLVRQVLHEHDGIATLSDLDGVRRIFAFGRLPGTDAHLAVGLHEGEVLRRVDSEERNALMLLGLVVVIVLLGTWFVGERLIVRPIRSLARMATRIGRGQLDARVSTKVQVPEFVPLALALDEMAGRLAVRDRELRVANAHLTELATIDTLSGLANRRAFDTRLASDWHDAATRAKPLSLLMIDVDHFKQFNDHRGHLDGDDCLRAIGEVLDRVTEGGDLFAARYGGEEFAVLAPQVDAEAATNLAERIRRMVEELCIANPGAPSKRVTVSIGVAVLTPAPGETQEALIGAADHALYAAKRRGRNAVAAQDAALVLLAS